MRTAIDALIAERGYAAITSHPLIAAEDRAHRATVDLIAELAGHPDVWCAPCSEVAAWVRGHRESFVRAPALGTATWD